MRKNRTYLTLNKVAMNYKESVLQANKLFKEEFENLGKLRSLMLFMADSPTHSYRLKPEFYEYLKASKADKVKYETLKAEVKLSKTGKVKHFALLQALNRLTK